uniref:Putative secreted protein n=1 Tax=Ixodes ricinus TaxID=34613 RepID=A0A6B0U3S9_IXORI
MPKAALSSGAGGGASMHSVSLVRAAVLCSMRDSSAPCTLLLFLGGADADSFSVKEGRAPMAVPGLGSGLCAGLSTSSGLLSSESCSRMPT